MGGYSIPSGVVISFTIDENALVASTQAAIQKMSAEIQSANKKNAQAIVSQISSPFQEQSARLRALYSTGQIGLKALQVEQKKLIDLQDQEINSLLKKDSLTKSELATLKQITLERERQANALKRGVGVGVTNGTSSALGLVTGGLQRNFAQLGARLIGVAGGSGLEASTFSGAAAGIAQITAAGGPAIAILGGLATAALAAGAATVALAISGGNLAERLSNISQQTGISIKDLQVLEAAGKTAEISLEDMVTGFRKFSQAVTGGGGGEAGGFEGAGKKSSELLKILGVTSKDSFTALEQLADAVSKLPDGLTKDAIVTEVFGKSALKLIPTLNEGRQGIEQFREIVNKFGPDINQNAIKSQQDWQKATGELDLAFQKLKVDTIPVLNQLTALTEGAAEFLRVSSTKPGDTFTAILRGIAQPGDAGTNIALNIAAIGDTAKKTGLTVDQMFSVADAVLTKFGATSAKVLKQAQGVLSGDELKKLIEEGRKELAALNEEAAKSSFSKLTDILSQSQLTSAGSGPAKTLEEQRQKLQQIAEIVLNFPQLAQQAQAAMAALTQATVTQLQQQADEALKKLNDDQDKEQSDRLKREQDLAKLIKDVDDDLAVSRAEATGNATAKIIAEEQKRLDDTIQKATLLGATEEQLQDLRVKLNQDAQARIQALQTEQLKKTREQISNEAGRLFDALVSGSKNFGQVLRQTLLSLALTPVKLIFQAVATAIFTPIVTQVKNQLQKLGEALKGKGGILGEIGKALAPDDKTVLNTTATLNNTSSTDRNTAALQNLTGALGGGSGTATPTPGAGIGQFGGVFGGATGAGSVIFNNQPGSGGGLSSIFGNVGPFIPGIISLAGNRTAAGRAGGALSLGGAALRRIGQVLGPNSGVGKALGKFGGIAGGAGDFISGITQGGLVGLAQTTIGGAEIGTAILPGIGTAIGAAVGFIAGGIRALFGGKTKQQKIADALKNQTLDSNLFSGNGYIGQEFDRSAQASFNQTVGSTFSEGPGGVFSSAPVASSAPVVKPTFIVQAMDSKGVQEFFHTHGTTVSAIISSRVNASNSGLARAVRTAVAPA